MRAMYMHPAFVRRGIGRLFLTLCEDAGRREGFSQVELMATLEASRSEPFTFGAGSQVLH